MLGGSGCSSSTDAGDTGTAATSSTNPGTSATGAQRFPEVVKAELTPAGASFDLSVTLSSPYDSPQRYADGWRVLAPDGTVLGAHTLTHDHADEQPVTRSQNGLEIPAGVERVTVEGSDTANGYGGATLTIDVPR